MLAYYESLRERVLKSKHILIIGAGSVGCEVSGEIKARFERSKKVTLVHARELPLTSVYTPKLRRKVANMLRKLDVQAIHNTLGYDNHDGTVTLQRNLSGTMSTEHISADMVLTDITPKPNTWFIPDEFKNANGAVQVLDTFPNKNRSSCVLRRRRERCCRSQAGAAPARKYDAGALRKRASCSQRPTPARALCYVTTLVGDFVR